jgi:hypothetical protein
MTRKAMPFMTKLPSMPTEIAAGTADDRLGYVRCGTAVVTSQRLMRVILVPSMLKPAMRPC